MNIQNGFRAIAIIMVLICCLLAGCKPAENNVQASNNEQRLVGTWVAVNDSSTWVFNSDKTGTTTIRRISFKYGAAESKVVIFFDNNPAAVADFSVSSDGRTLILSGLNGFQNPLGIGTSAWLFQKSN